MRSTGKIFAGSDLIGISTITSTVPRAYAIADKVRTMGIFVVMGGPVLENENQAGEGII